MKKTLLFFALFFAGLIYGQDASAPSIGDGSPEHPFEIATWQNLYWISIHPEHWNKHYIQKDNINLAEAAPAINTWNSSTGWSPIGNMTTKFTGKYDGDGHTISGLYISRSADFQGLFGYTSGCIIKKVSLTNVSISGINYVGGLVGINSNHSTISYSYSSGNVNGSENDVGGLVGNNGGSTISNSYSSGNVTGFSNLGGLVGVNVASTISNSYSSGWVGSRMGGGGPYSVVGGLVGANSSSTVSNCFWDKQVNPTRDNGVGTGKTTVEMKLFSTYVNAGWDFIGETINGSNSHWGINETGSQNNGYPFLQWQGYALVGRPWVTIEQVSSILGSTATGNATIRFLGYPNPPTEHGICWSTNVNPTTSDYKTTQGSVSSTGTFTSSITGLLPYTTYYVRAYATNDIGTSYGAQISFSCSGFEGLGTESIPFLIKSLNDLKFLSEHSELWNKSFKQTTDIDASVTSTWSSGGWIPIGNSTIQFRGKYDGDGHTISGLYISRSADNQGLFGYTFGSTIRNISLTNVNITGRSYVGGLVGVNAASTVDSCYSSGSVSSISILGGLAGANTASSIISKSYSNAYVNGDGWVGGLVGVNNGNATIINSYSSGTVDGKGIESGIGGLVGYSYETASLINCYSRGSVSGITEVGGMVGKIGESTVSNCFWDKTENPTLDNGIGIGKTTSEMTTNSTFLDAGWDPSIWNIGDGINNGYLYLKWQNTSGTPLPVELTSFAANAEEGKVILSWATATEVNNYGFEVERLSVIGNQSSVIANNPNSEIPNPQWEVVGFVEGHGNSNSPKQYSFIDENPPVGNLQYRLKQIDTDGKFLYHFTIVEVIYNLTSIDEKQIPTEFSLEQNYPNPFNPETVISYTIGTGQLSVISHAALKVYDLLGNEVATLVNEQQQPGCYQVKFDGSNLSSGIYIYRLNAGSFTSTKKLILVK